MQELESTQAAAVGGGFSPAQPLRPLVWPSSALDDVYTVGPVTPSRAPALEAA